jgi:hypothetical protein
MQTGCFSHTESPAENDALMPGSIVNENHESHKSYCASPLYPESRVLISNPGDSPALSAPLMQQWLPFLRCLEGLTCRPCLERLTGLGACPWP